MLLIIGGCLALVAAGVLVRGHVPGGANGATLGWMSQQWLAEQRASHPQQ